MRFRVHHFLLVALPLFSSCATRPSLVDSSTDERAVPPVRPVRCAFGHTELKTIPVAYGLLLSDAETEGKFQRMEVWRGGCVIGPYSYDTKLICRTCQYAYQDGLDYWSKVSRGNNTFVNFKIPPKPLIATFPVWAGTQSGPPSYAQDVRNGSALLESCSYSSDLPFAFIVEKLQQHLVGADLNTATQDRSSGTRRHRSFYSRSGEDLLEVEVMKDDGQTFVRANLIYPGTPRYRIGLRKLTAGKK